MDKYFKRLPKLTSASSSEELQTQPKRCRLDANITDLPADPGLRPRISDYPVNDQDEVRRNYLLKGPCQPEEHVFPMTMFSGGSRKFISAWFKQFGPWLEYSIEKDAAFCLFCYLFKPDIGQQAGCDVFVYEGFRNWKNGISKFKEHVGGPDSIHNKAKVNCENLMNQKQHIQVSFCKQSDQARKDYRDRLGASIDCIRFLLQQGLAFRGNNQSNTSNNQGNFLELLKFLAEHNENINSVVLKNAPENLKLTTPDIQKDIINAMASETTNAIIRDIGDAFYSVLIDESRDASVKEQMALALRYVNKKGCVIERFLGIVHVSDTTAHSLKMAIEAFFSKHGLSISRLRGQGYDGASNMRGELNGLKTLIMNENKYAYYIHCFAHQLQLALVVVAKNHSRIAWLFECMTVVSNIVGASCKRRDLLRESQTVKIMESIEKGELISGTGQNQERNLTRAGDTRWSSHYGAILNLIVIFSSVVDVLELIEKDHRSSTEHKALALSSLELVQSFNFIIALHLMKNILGITNSLSQALQRKEQDIVNAMIQFKISKQRLQEMRNDGWEHLLTEVSSFCNEHKIDVPNMNDEFKAQGRSRRKVSEMTNMHHYRVDLFYSVIDKQLSELDNCFTEVSTELLLCMQCLNPNDSFSAFDKKKLRRLAEFYPLEFSAVDLMELENQLETYFRDVCSDEEFSHINGIGDLSEKMVAKKKNRLYPLVYLLITLALTLPVATATVERAFSAMNIVKNRLRNRMEDQMMNDCLVTHIEKDIFDNIDKEVIMQRFQNMKNRRGQL